MAGDLNECYNIQHKIYCNRGVFMKINFEKEYIEINDIKIPINKLINAETIWLACDGVGASFLYIDYGQYLFLYDNNDQYTNLLRSVASKPDRAGAALRLYKNNFGVEHILWKRLLSIVFKKFGINPYEYGAACGISSTSDYLIEEYGGKNLVPQQIENICETYDELIPVLPKNYDKTKKKRAEIALKELVDIYDDNFEKLENENGNDLERWESTIKNLEGLRSKLQYFLKERTNELSGTYKIDEYLETCFRYAYDRIRLIGEKELLEQYGPITDLKRKLRDSINHFGFMELLELYKEYKKKETCLFSEGRYDDRLRIESALYKKYIDVFRLGSVLISNRMNQINQNKARHKYIPQDLLDEAMVFYYEGKSVQDSYKAQSDEKYFQEKKGGNKGEQKVEYALKWLDPSFIRIKRKSIDRVGDKCIRICNPDFVDEKQEYDHLIISNKGIFNVETKNYTGKLIIDKYGNWIRKKKDLEEGVKNPIQQIRQHEKMLRSFLEKECNIISIICIANDKAIIEGVENCVIPIVKSDMLVEFIEKWNLSDIEMSDEQKEKCVMDIYNHML